MIWVLHFAFVREQRRLHDLCLIPYLIEIASAELQCKLEEDGGFKWRRVDGDHIDDFYAPETEQGRHPCLCSGFSSSWSKNFTLMPMEPRTRPLPPLP